MKRRRFLQSATGVFPLALMGTLQMAAAADAGTGEVRVVKTGEDVTGTLFTLGYSTMAIRVTTRETRGRILLLEHTKLTKGGPPLHLHHEQEEWFYVEEGEVLFQIGEKRMKLGAGESVLAPRKVPHAFAGASDQPAKMLIGHTPAGKMEGFFRDIGKVPLEKRDAEFYRKYGVEHVGPPLKVE